MPAPVPTLTTPRLRLTPIDPARDRDGLFALLADPAVTRYLDVEPFADLADVDRLLAVYAQRGATGDFFDWAVRPLGSETILGACNLACDRDRRRAEVGYFFCRSAWGQGYGKETVTALLDFGFGPQEMNRIEALVYTENSASRALLSSLGFALEGVLREHAWEHGRFWDDAVYGLLAREWAAATRPG